MKPNMLIQALMWLCVVLVGQTVYAQTLEEGFAAPPASAKPGTWFHVMSGNMNREGLTLDLQSMAQVGIGQVTMFHVTQGIPLGRVKFNSDEHVGLVAHAAAQARRLGLNFGLHNTDGWTSSGGPWITPDQSMKRVVWSETHVLGGQVTTRLAPPPTAHNYYQDIATIAFPALRGAQLSPPPPLVFTATGARFDAGIVNDRRHDETTLVQAIDGTARLTINLGAVREIAHVDMLVDVVRGVNLQVSGSVDGQNWQPLGVLKQARSGKSEITATGDWTQTRVSYLKIEGNGDFSPKEVSISGVRHIGDFYARSGLSDYRDRATLVPLAREPSLLGDTTGLVAIDPAQIIDLSQKVSPDGTLTTTLPEGFWTIMRFGVTTTGAVNVPASPEGTGLEVDKFSKAAVEAHYKAYMGRVVAASRALDPNALEHTIIDSYEVGGQNWTDGYWALFKQASGRDISRYLPLYAGYLVGSVEESGLFYEQIRALNSRLMSENYFGHFTKLANADRLKVYIQGYGFGPFSELDATSVADIPMGEFWLGRPNEQLSAMVSTAHIYNKPVVAAEAFTAFPELNWGFYPGMAKTRGDDAWTKGINRFVFHRFAHQANTHVMPGMTMNRWGAHFDRHQPWWNKAGASWFGYMARGQFLLQQGQPIVDVAYFVGDSAPSTCPSYDQQKAFLPAGYKADCINADVLIHRSRLSSRTLTLPNGIAYSAIVLGNSRYLTSQTIARLEQAARAGVLIFGAKPAPLVQPGASRSWVARTQRQIDRLWARAELGAVATLPARLSERLTPDFVVLDGPKLSYMHRRTPEADIYFTFNPEATTQTARVSLRHSGSIPEIWDGVTGQRHQVTQFSLAGGRTELTLALGAGQSSFIVLPKGAAPAGPPAAIDTEGESRQIATLTAWTVDFKAATGERFEIATSPLVNFKDSADPRIVAFAGTARYKTNLDVAAGDIEGAKAIVLDLGSVEVAATVIVNGVEVATSWIGPHKIEITSAIRAGQNTIEVDVATLWNNRLIADAALPDTSGYVVADRSNKPTTKMVPWYSDNQPPPPGPRSTFSTQPFFSANDPRVSAGLIGPVSVSVRK